MKIMKFIFLLMIIFGAINFNQVIAADKNDKEKIVGCHELDDEWKSHFPEGFKSKKRIYSYKHSSGCYLDEELMTVEQMNDLKYSTNYGRIKAIKY